MAWNSRWVMAIFVTLAVLAVLAAADASPSGAQQPRLCDGVEATIVGTGGDDRLVGTAGPDVIAALQGDDTIFGLAGDDIICGGFGDDIIIGGPGFDIMFGAQGNDLLVAANGRGAAVRRDERGARMFGGAGNDELIGSNRWDRMQGGDGADLLMGFEGQDWMRAGGSADLIDGGLGSDDIRAGWGADRIDVGRGDDLRAGLGSDRCNIDGQAQRLWSCEAQVPLESVPFEQQVDGGYFGRIRATEPPVRVAEVFQVIEFDVDGIGVSAHTNLEVLPDRATRVAFDALVIDNGLGPEACLGGQLDSDPPQCGGPLVDGLDFHPTWATYYSTTTLGQRALEFSWPPVDDTVTLLEDRGNRVFAIDIAEGDRPGPLPIPGECADIDNFVDRSAMIAWAGANPDRAAGIYAALGGPIIVVNVVGDAEPIRAELRTADAEPCVVGGAEFSTAELTATGDELLEMSDELIAMNVTGWGVGALKNRVIVSVNVPDRETVRAIASLVSQPESLFIESSNLIILE